jgi:hypothetical protein
MSIKAYPGWWVSLGGGGSTMGWTMPSRRRVGFLQSFKLAGKAGLKAEDPTNGVGALLGTVIFGIWWWIVGAPVDGEDQGKT